MSTETPHPIPCEKQEGVETTTKLIAEKNKANDIESEILSIRLESVITEHDFVKEQNACLRNENTELKDLTKMLAEELELNKGGHQNDSLITTLQLVNCQRIRIDALEQAYEVLDSKHRQAINLITRFWSEKK